jgi:hypothetical protein
MKPWKLFIFLLPLFCCQSVFAQVSKDAAVEIEVTTSKSPLGLTLRWLADAQAIGYDVYRRNIGSSNWGGPVKHLARSINQYIDSSIIIGKVYEYRVVKNYQFGNLSGAYLYKITFVTGQGETQGGTTSASMTPASGQIILTSIRTGPPGVTQRKIYRTAGGGADGTQKFVAAIPDNVTNAFIDDIGDASLGSAVPVVNNAMTPPPAPTEAPGGTGLLNGTYLYKVTFVTSVGETNGGSTSVPIILNKQKDTLKVAKGPVGTTARKLYRTVAGGQDGTQKLVGIITNDTSTTFIDSVADGSLGSPVPTINTAYAPPGAPNASYLVFTADGYTESCIERPAVNDRGKLILLVDKTFSDNLKTELARLEDDLWNDGWHVIRHDMLRTETLPNVKSTIVNDWNNDPTNTQALFIFGHVPVPYSGFLNPDGHPDHFGAWPADVYYGEFDSGDWPDDLTEADSNSVRYSGAVIDTNGIRKANLNLTGDGKFDYSQIPGQIYLMIGRVDLSNMDTTGGVTEYALLKKYLDKDHNFRTGNLTAPPRALLEDDFGFFGGEAFASSGWRNLAPLVGIDSIHQFPLQQPPSDSVDWMPEISTHQYLWAYGCGGGWDNGAGGAGSTHQFATQDGKAIFTMLFGSYFGDWNTGANFLRAPLTTSYGLSCAWSGRPYWQFFPMGLGEPLGYCARLTQNNSGDYVYNYAANWVHISLMGDPTLLMHPYVPPTGLSVTANTQHNNALLSWQPTSDKNIIGYNIYRSNSPIGTYSLITPAPVSGTSYTDNNPLVDTNAYSVRAVKLETTPSGSYYNLSAGARGWISGLIKNGVATQENTAKDNLQVLYTINGVEIILQKSNTSYTKIETYDASGRLIRTFDNRTLSSGMYRYDWQTASIPSGIYFVRAEGLKELLVAKVLVVN